MPKPIWGGRSTEDAIVDLIESMNDMKKPMCAMFDLEKAFDSVCHRVLLHKLEAMGVRENALAWIRSYLSNRTTSLYTMARNAGQHPFE